jgi:hypothetical protein
MSCCVKLCQACVKHVSSLCQVVSRLLCQECVKLCQGCVRKISRVLSKFPSERERFEFPDYLLKAESFFSAKDMLDVINTPIVPETRAASDTTVYLGVELVGKTDKASIEKLQALRNKSNKALNYIIQSLHRKQLELIRHLKPLNAYNALNVLKKNYGIIKSTNTALSLMSSLNANRKLTSETMSDYFARIDRMIADLRTINESNTMNDKMKQTYILNGLQDDLKWKHIASMIAQFDIDGKMTSDTLQQHLIDQEERQIATSSSSASTTSPSSLASDDENKPVHDRAYISHHQSRRHRFVNHRPPRHHDEHNRSRSPDRYEHHYSDSAQHRRHIICFSCNEPGHVSSQCPNNEFADIKCKWCGHYGHSPVQCRQRERSPSPSSSSMQASSYAARTHATTPSTRQTFSF